MKKKYEIAGQIMGFFESFKGSRPAIDNESILIVRGKSRKTIKIDDFEEKLIEIGKIINGIEIDKNSKEILEILKTGDKHIQKSEKTTVEVDDNGFIRMSKELEAMGLIVGYKVFEVEGFNVIIAIWEDKHEIPPLYVEVTVSER